MVVAADYFLVIINQNHYFSSIFRSKNEKIVPFEVDCDLFDIYIELGNWFLE
jgi:hypothetical protein